MDVNSAFLNRVISEEVFVKQPPGFDTTLFRRTLEKDILVVQIYVNDIIFGSTNASLCKEFSKLMQNEFEMSMMGELKFFLGIKINHFKVGVYVHQTK